MSSDWNVFHGSLLEAYIYLFQNIFYKFLFFSFAQNSVAHKMTKPDFHKLLAHKLFTDLYS